MVSKRRNEKRKIGFALLLLEFVDEKLEAGNMGRKRLEESLLNQNFWGKKREENLQERGKSLNGQELRGVLPM